MVFNPRRPRFTKAFLVSSDETTVFCFQSYNSIHTPWLEKMPALWRACCDSTFLDGMDFMLWNQRIAPDSGTINPNPALRHVTIYCQSSGWMLKVDYTS